MNQDDLHDLDEAPRDDLSGEDLSRGPTPETRHPAGHVEDRDFAEDDSEIGETAGDDDVRDTTQGPTPETRQTMRATDDDSAAAAQPDADLKTRADVGGNQGRRHADARPHGAHGSRDDADDDDLRRLLARFLWRCRPREPGLRRPWFYAWF